MSRFLQLHILTAYPPANLNRDDLGRPKTAIVGGYNRLRVSSQSLKRAWRTSDLFRSALDGHLGIRTKRLGEKLQDDLKNLGVSQANAEKWAGEIAESFGKRKSKGLEIEQLAHLGPEELKAIDALVQRLSSSNVKPTEQDLQLLHERPSAADIALFGRMIAKDPKYNVEAAAQIAHAITVHEAAVEDDYFTAVDDLSAYAGEDGSGAGHLGENEFGAGFFYLYACIDRETLAENLHGKPELVNPTLRALIEAAAKIGPSGKQASFGSRAYATYMLAEKGDQQPRSLSLAFYKPVRPNRDRDIVGEAIQRLEDTRQHFDTVYGACADAHTSFNVLAGTGSLDKLIAFAAD